MAYLVALILVAGFTVNVVMGAINGTAPLGVVAEMLILFGAAIAFSIGILRSEARAKASNDANE